jgi:predicted amidohydrolase
MKASRRDATIAAAQFVAKHRDVEANVRRHVRLASRAADHGARMVVFPELSLTSYDLALTVSDALTPDDSRLRPLAALARTRDLILVAGAPIVVDDSLYIGAIAFRREGRPTTYLKQYPTINERRTFMPGPTGVTIALKDDIVGLAICADVGHVEHARDAAKRGATIYAAGSLVSEDGYAADATMLRRYAAEHSMLALLANYGAPTGGYAAAGRSAAWSDKGKLLATAPPNGDALVVARRAGSEWTATAFACPE